MSSTKPLIVVLGLGEMGLIHAKNLSKIRAIRLGLASSRPDVLKKHALALNADRTFSSYGEALDDLEVAGVVVSTPPPTHPDMITRAAEKGKHIFSEKPLGYDSSEIRAALDAVSRAGVRFMPGFQRRWDRSYIAARKAVVDGSLGDPIVVKCTSGDPEYPEKYHRGAGAEHALLKDLSVHDVDLARWLTRSEVKRVYVVCDALTYPILKENNDGDIAIAVLEMESGAKAILHESRAFAFGYDVTTELFCKKGAMQIGELKKTAATTIMNETRSTDVIWHFSDRFPEAFAREMEAFADLVTASSSGEAQALLRTNDSYATAHDGLIATIICEALVKSSLSGLPELVEYPRY